MKKPMRARKRILFLAEGATMTHFVRPLALADSLDPERYEVHLRAPEQFSRYLENKPYATSFLDAMPGQQFLANLAQGKPLFPPEVVRRYVNEDRKILRSVQPDIVIGDMRPSLSISARLENTPSAVIMNAYWSPYAKHRAILPELPLTRIIPPSLLQLIYPAAQPIAFALHVRQMNRVRKEFGLGPLPLDVRHMYTDADYVLYADVPEFIPTADAPPNHVYIGICDWEAPVQKPDWWDRMIADPRPKVFVSLGSSGPLRVLPALMRALTSLSPAPAVVLSTSGRAPATEPRADYVADFLPFRETAGHSALVVSHGGSGGLYPALAAGAPVLAIPSNADQHLAAAALTDSGAGLSVRIEHANFVRLRRVLDTLLRDESVKGMARLWKSTFLRYETPLLLRRFLVEKT